MSFSRIARLGLYAGVLAMGTAGQTQSIRTPQFTIEGGAFKAPVSDGTRMIALVSGREAKPALLAGQMVITGFQLETYDENQKPELRVESPSSVFDSKGATSDRSIALQSVDGRFRVTGEGWSWQQATGLLVISNQVQTILRRSDADTNQPPVEVRAERLEYNLKTGETKFLRQCEAVQPGQARIKAEELTSRLGTRLDRPEAILARGGVRIEILRPGREGTATGDQAQYAMSPEGERVELSGNPGWQFGPTAGTAEQLVLLPAKEAYTARGNARMRLRTGSRSPVTTGSADASEMEISSDVIDAEAGRVTFSGSVSARQAGRFELDATQVIVELAEDRALTSAQDSLRQVTATGQVTARLDVRGTPFTLHGQQMVYSLGEHAMIEVTGDPAWEATGHSGKAERFVIHPEVPSFQALGGVNVTWSEPESEGDDRLRIRLEAAHMRVEGLLARFEGDVSVHEKSWDLSAREVDLGMTTNAVLDRIAARGDVLLNYRAFEEWTAPEPAGALTAFLRQATEAASPWVIRGQEMQGRLAPDHSGLVSMDAFGGVHIEHVSLEAHGEHLAYRAEDGRLRLMKEPVFRTAEGFQIIGRTETSLALDPGTGRFFVEGPVKRMSMPVQAIRAQKEGVQ